MTSDHENAVESTNRNKVVENLEKSDEEDEQRSLTISDNLKDDAKLEFLKALPNPIKRRLRALNNLQLEATNIDAEFYQQVHALECEFLKKYSAIYDKRRDIVNGVYEPTDEEAEWSTKYEHADISELLQTGKEGNADKKETAVKEDNDNVKGIPGFWLHVLENYTDTQAMIQHCDRPILQHLIDIRVVCPENEMKFVLEFHFSPNEYFEDEVVKKAYFLKCVPPKENPFQFEGPEIYKSTGHIINWKKDKDVTKKTVTKHQKHKGNGTVRKINKVVNTDSFFMFFAPLVIPEGIHGSDLDEEINRMVTMDFTIGHAIRDSIVPKAALVFTSMWTGFEDDNYAEDETEEEEDDDDDDDDVEEEESDSDSSHSGKDECKQQ